MGISPAKQSDVDNGIKTVLNTIAADIDIMTGISILDKTIGLIDLLDSNILSPRQIAKKISSYSVDPTTGLTYTDVQLNKMYYGQDLQYAPMLYIDDNLVPNPGGYIAYVTESEDMVTNLAGYEPVDIRDQIKDKIHEIVRETRKDLLSFETSIKNLIISLPRSIAQSATGLESIITPQKQVPPLPLIVTNASSAAQIASNLHNVAHLMRKEIMEAIFAIRVFSTVDHLTLGANFNSSVKVSTVVTPAINGAPPIKKMKTVNVNQIPKIQFLLNDTILGYINSIFVAILKILNSCADIVVGLDLVSGVIETVALAPTPGQAVLAAEIITMKTLLSTLKTIISEIPASIPGGGAFRGGKSATFNPVNPPTTSNSNLNQVNNNSNSVTTASNAINITPNNITINIGETTKLNDSLDGGQWSSSNMSVASVDKNGNVTGKNIGSVIISYNVSSSNITATSSVIVKQ